MYKLRVRIHPHNTLEALAHHHVAAVQAKLQANDYRSISHDCTSAVIAMAFTVEAVMNYVGAKKVSSWKERAPFRKKVKLLEERLDFKFDKAVEPFATLTELKKARDAMAHGQPVEFEVSVETPEHVGKSMQPTWSASTKPEFVVEAHQHVEAFKALLFQKAKLKLGASYTSAIGGG
jgi:beta-xylosidase